MGFISTFDVNSSKAIARSMGAAIDEVLWPQRSVWLPARQGKALHCKVGSGQATYFKPSRKVDSIVFGNKMVTSKCTEFAGQWLSYRELVRFNYFDGVTSPLNLLAHTVCHEFGHYLQAHYKQRRRGEVHNHAFYKYLDAIYKHAYAEKVRLFLAEAHPELCRLESIVATPVDSLERPQHPTKATLNVGDTVRFNNRGVVTEGIVIRLNRKTVSVGSKHAYWRVPFHLLS